MRSSVDDFHSSLKPFHSRLQSNELSFAPNPSTVPRASSPSTHHSFKPKWWARDREKPASDSKKPTQSCSQSQSQQPQKTRARRKRRKAANSSAKRQNPKTQIVMKNPWKGFLQDTHSEFLEWSPVKAALYVKLKSILPNTALWKRSGKRTRSVFCFEFNSSSHFKNQKWWHVIEFVSFNCFANKEQNLKQWVGINLLMVFLLCVCDASQICLVCRRRGHTLKNCPSKNDETESTKLCYNCGQAGHSLAQCPQPLQDGIVQICRFKDALCCFTFAIWCG